MKQNYNMRRVSSEKKKLLIHTGAIFGDQSYIFLSKQTDRTLIFQQNIAQ